jgi:hypothetical protein
VSESRKSPTFVIDGRELDVPTDATLGETMEVERALGVDFKAAGAVTQLAVSLFVALRRDQPKTEAADIAEIVRSVDVLALLDSFQAQAANGSAAAEAKEDPGPPAEAPGGAAGSSRKKTRA